MNLFMSGAVGFGIIGGILQFVMYVAVIAFCIRGTKAINIYIQNNEDRH